MAEKKISSIFDNYRNMISPEDLAQQRKNEAEQELKESGASALFSVKTVEDSPAPKGIPTPGMRVV